MPLKSSNYVQLKICKDIKRKEYLFSVSHVNPCSVIIDLWETVQSIQGLLIHVLVPNSILIGKRPRLSTHHSELGSEWIDTCCNPNQVSDPQPPRTKQCRFGEVSKKHLFVEMVIFMRTLVSLTHNKQFHGFRVRMVGFSFLKTNDFNIDINFK